MWFHRLAEKGVHVCVNYIGQEEKFLRVADFSQIERKSKRTATC